MTCMTSLTFKISLPQEVVELIDERARCELSSRSEFIQRAVTKQLQTDRALADVFDRANERGRAMGYTPVQGASTPGLSEWIVDGTSCLPET